jgi:hypothetical protein
VQVRYESIGSQQAPGSAVGPALTNSQQQQRPYTAGHGSLHYHGLAALAAVQQQQQQKQQQHYQQHGIMSSKQQVLPLVAIGQGQHLLMRDDGPSSDGSTRSSTSQML